MSKLTFISNSYRACSGPTQRFTSIRSLHTSNLVYDKEDEKNSESEPCSQKEHVSSKKVEVQAKLKDLLLSMSKKEELPESVKKIQVPRPRVKAQKEFYKWKEEQLKAKAKAEEEQLGNQLAKAAEDVAESLGGDTQKTEQELLELYLSSHKPQASPEISEAESDLQKKEVSQVNMKDLLGSMKIDKEVPKEFTRAHQVRVLRSRTQDGGTQFTHMRRPRSSSGPAEKVDIFSESPLGIFTTEEAEKKMPSVENPTWDYLYQRDLRLSVTHAPANIFEQLIMWTDQGKIWKFPIDNEQDWKEEENVNFTEHVFLERWLDPWCPESGPIRHFMELVCVGLSKNPYLTVADKKAHIIFYEHYFRSRNALLTDLGLEPVRDRHELEQQQV